MPKPPFEITPKILNLVIQIGELLGQLKEAPLSKKAPLLRKSSQIKTICHSLAIEGNTLSEEQISALIENKRVLGPRKQIIEVKNAIHLYHDIDLINPLSEKDFLKAHERLMQKLIEKPGRYRSGNVGVFKGQNLSHLAPPANLVPKLMKETFEFLKKNMEISWLIKACVFHYELEFIHPFEDGNGRMGRLWQHLILMKHSPVFNYVSIETLIHSHQEKYYFVLEKSDKMGNSTLFIEFSLEMIKDSLVKFLEETSISAPGPDQRVAFALDHFGKQGFSRRDYRHLFSSISTATASRDLSLAVQKKWLSKSGDKSTTRYRKKT